ncbi:hypothetical protein BCR37DRAFT_384609 [Protomyces lactucae-debilis]|uniref:Uncharacterized protein n=1 Tax=Protomyces lactucae-debilis TaxID=2754530 RepID=A0A1Y2EQL8_PROLT|nr:uncharacterized protein BCR37DRAFT_384609 [Protomyces lactucae-debilis]ORY73893.1 hypothetical protein BCR37DRAFT_384609 [Protomyces lactucae-debilis]
MQCTRQLRRLSVRLSCLGNIAKKRPYSFAKEIESVLAAFNVDTGTPISSPASSAALASFHKKVINTRVPTGELANEYRSFQRHSTIRALPLLTCKLFLRRLLADLQVRLAVQVLLAYDLNDSVNLVTDVLHGLQIYEQRTFLVMLFSELRRLSQHGIAKQICAATGYSPSAMSQLTDQHEQVADIETFQVLSKRLFGTSTLDGWTVLVLCKQLLQSELLAEAESLVTRHPQAHHAVRFLVERLPRPRAAALFVSLAEEADYDLHTWRVALGACDEHQLQSLAESAKSLDIKLLVAESTARHTNTLPISYTMATTLSLISSETKALGSLFASWLHTSPATIAHNPHEAAMQAILRNLADEDTQHLSDLLLGFAEAIQQHSTASLYAVLRLVEDMPYDLPFHVEHKLTRHVLNKPADEAALYFALRKTSKRAMHAVVNHHLRAHRLGAEDGQFFGSLLLLSKRLGIEASALQSVFDLCIMQLIEVRPPTLALSLLRTCEALEISPALDSIAKLMRVLTRNRYYDIVLHLLTMSMPNSGTALTKALKVQRNIFARFILHTASKDATVSMRALREMRRKGFVPSAFLLQSMALRLASHRYIPGSSVPCSSSVLFRYISRIIRLAGTLGYKSGGNRGFASSLVRLVLLRQGLGASKERIKYTLGRSRKSLQQQDFEELMRILRQWRALTEHSAGSTNMAAKERLARQRPRELRHLLARVDGRRRRIFGTSKRRRRMLKRPGSL